MMAKLKDSLEHLTARFIVVNHHQTQPRQLFAAGGKSLWMVIRDVHGLMS
jgi:hypothetical protein